MKRRPAIVIAVVLVALLAGCAGFGSSGDTTTPGTTMESTTQTTATPTATTTATPTATTSTTTEQTTTTTTTATTTTTTAAPTTEAWSEPQEPNKPLQDNRDDSDGSRIKSMTFVDKTEANGGGYSDFDIRLTANTTMESIDPKKHGDVVGEPYFLVYVNASFDSDDRFMYVEGDLIARDDVGQDERGEYTLEIDPRALEEMGVEKGEVEVTVMLMDQDKEWDDIYGIKQATIEYSPEE